MKRLLPCLCALLTAGCLSTPKFSKSQVQARISMEQKIAAEPPGDYFIGRRYFKTDYKMWGYLRKPGQPWSSAQLVMLNEDKLEAPDRANNAVGSDNGHEYLVWGKFSGETVYEPAANQFYPEFVPQKFELKADAPAPIFASPKALDPEERYYPEPM